MKETKVPCPTAESEGQDREVRAKKLYVLLYLYKLRSIFTLIPRDTLVCLKPVMKQKGLVHFSIISFRKHKNIHFPTFSFYIVHIWYSNIFFMNIFFIFKCMVHYCCDISPHDAAGNTFSMWGSNLVIFLCLLFNGRAFRR